VKRKPRLDEFENIFSASLLDEGLELSHIKKNWKIIEDKSSLSGTYNEVGFPAIHAKINKTNQYILNFTCDCLLFTEAKDASMLPDYSII
jgi:TATA-box binding protein (TBP) (component of TFIID and TFIIIB)